MIQHKLYIGPPQARQFMLSSRCILPHSSSGDSLQDFLKFALAPLDDALVASSQLADKAGGCAALLSVGCGANDVAPHELRAHRLSVHQSRG